MSEETKTGDGEPGPTAEVDVGVRPAAFQTWQSTRVNFHGFEALTTTKGEEVESPEFTCLGHRWFVDIFPGGDEMSEDGSVAIFLNSRSDERVSIHCVLIVRDSADRKVTEWRYNVPSVSEDTPNNSWGCWNLIQRSKLMKVLVEGSLVLEVRMKHSVRSNALSAPFIPENPLRKNIVDVYDDEDSSDIVFEVSEQDLKGGRKRRRAKSDCTEFHAHSFVIQRSASLLAELCKPGAGGKGARATSVLITGMKPDVFDNMLYYLYGGDLMGEDLDANEWKDLIDAADKYNVVHLKLEAEARYAQLTNLTTENALDNLLYADSKNLALLKEVVMDFLMENGEDVIENVSFDDVPGHMMKDLLAAVNRGKKKESNSGGTKYSNMRVSSIRELLYNARLDVDGSREAMIARLKENDKKGDDNGADADTED